MHVCSSWALSSRGPSSSKPPGPQVGCEREARGPARGAKSKAYRDPVNSFCWDVAVGSQQQCPLMPDDWTGSCPQVFPTSRLTSHCGPGVESRFLPWQKSWRWGHRRSFLLCGFCSLGASMSKSGGHIRGPDVSQQPPRDPGRGPLETLSLGACLLVTAQLLVVSRSRGEHPSTL